MNEIQTIATNVETHWEQIGATLISGYSFVIAHGGLIPMWNKFLGTTQQVESKTNEKINPPIVNAAPGSSNSSVVSN